MKGHSRGTDGVWGIILAAGIGSRFGGSKQFERLGELRLIDHSVRTTGAACEGTVLVLPQGVQWDGAPVDGVATGGPTRTASLRAGLAMVPAKAEKILVSDSAHPLASLALFESVVAALDMDGIDVVVPVLPSTDTIVRVHETEVVEVIPRKGLASEQTPQGFRAAILRGLHETGDTAAPDDGVLAFQAGITVKTVPGEPTNVHIATGADLQMAAKLLDVWGDGVD
jgi:2-C-methyl-D-erythritol 4-phosphate cytidylyltransferase